MVSIWWLETLYLWWGGGDMVVVSPPAHLYCDQEEIGLPFKKPTVNLNIKLKNKGKEVE